MFARKTWVRVTDMIQNYIKLDGVPSRRQASVPGKKSDASMKAASFAAASIDSGC